MKTGFNKYRKNLRDKLGCAPPATSANEDIENQRFYEKSVTFKSPMETTFRRAAKSDVDIISIQNTKD